MKKILIITLLLISHTAYGFQYVSPNAFKSPLRRAFEKVLECKWRISCYSGNLGAFTQLNSTDRQVDFPATYNANLAITMETGTTSVSSITTLPNLTSAASLATVGTITSGTWNGTTLTVAFGGTGSTTLSSNQVLLGNGTTQLKTVSGLGTSGQFLQSQGAGTPPIWASSAVDQGANYVWTGPHMFTASTSFTASTTFTNTATSTHSGTTSIAANANAALLLNGVDYAFPSTEGASSSVLSTGGTGALSWNQISELGAGVFLGATSTFESIIDTTTETELATGTIATLPANLMGTTGAIRVGIYVAQYSDNAGANTGGTLRVKFGVTTVCSHGFNVATSAGEQGYFEFIIVSNGSASSQLCFSYTDELGTGASVLTTGTASVNTGVDQAITISYQWGGNDGGDTENFRFSGATIQFLGRR